MRAHHVARLRKLEQRQAEDQGKVHRKVIRLPWDALAEPPPELPNTGLVQTVYLPRKAPSAEAWAEKVRQRWPEEQTSCPD